MSKPEEEALLCLFILKMFEPERAQVRQLQNMKFSEI